MVDVFVSHVEDDSVVASEIAKALEAHGYSTWYYERDTVPGPSYLIQVAQAIESSRAILLIISVRSLGSQQVTKEVVRGHESNKPFIPILMDVSHLQFQSRQPEWRAAIGAAASVPMVDRQAMSVIAKVVTGLKGLGLEPSASSDVLTTAGGIRSAGRVSAHVVSLSTSARREPEGIRFRIRLEGENRGSRAARWGGLTLNLPGITSAAAVEACDLSVSTSGKDSAVVRSPGDTVHGFRSDGSYGEIAAKCLLVETAEGIWNPGERLWLEMSAFMPDGDLEAHVRAWATWEASNGSLTSDGDPSWTSERARDQQGIPAYRVIMSLGPM